MVAGAAIAVRGADQQNIVSCLGKDPGGTSSQNPANVQSIDTTLHSTGRTRVMLRRVKVDPIVTAVAHLRSYLKCGAPYIKICNWENPGIRPTDSRGQALRHRLTCHRIRLHPSKLLHI